MQNMYPGKVNSPQTELASAIDDEQTTIPLLDASVLPDPPNLATIGTGENAETVLYEGKNGNDLTDVTRGFQGAAQAWSAGQKVARLFTEYDYEALADNIRDLAGGIDDLAGEGRTTETVKGNADALAAHKAETVTNIVNLANEFGADPTGATDSSVAFQNAVDSLPNGGIIYCPGRFLIGGIIVNAENILIIGRSTDDQLIIKNGTTGITIRQNFVSFENITIISEGTKGDGLGTNGIWYEKTPVNSIGFARFSNVNIKNFSGYGLKVINAIHFTYDFGFVRDCNIGVGFDRDSGGSLFGTTVTMKRVYVHSCTRGIEGIRLYRSSFEQIIAEFCDYGIYLSIGTGTLFRCYFENNNIKGCFAQDFELQDLYTYSNNTNTDGVQVTFTGATLAADRGYIRDNKFDVLAKRVGILSNFGADPQYFSAYGDNNNAGLQYGNSIVPLIRGDNLADPAAWVSNRLAEFQGWDFTKQGYKIQGVTAGDLTYGLQQTVTLDNTKQYVIDFAATTVQGTGITTIRCGALTVTNGVPFTPPANGANVIKAFGTDPAGTTFEVYVHAFSISEVNPQQKYTAIAQNRLTSRQEGRGRVYMSAPPTSGYWAVGEIVWNSAPTAGGYVGWICITAGSPGTWKGFGQIQT